ncbi:MAG TPA: PhoU domain-containing protein [Opitutales bacterium]|nr:PhoU domain-containing protein [Opitutales bacterium]
MWKTIRSLFHKDDLYTQALHESYTMLDMDLEMFEASVEALRRSPDSDVPIDIYEMDKQINAYEREVRRKVMTHLTISGPADLSAGLVLVSVVIDIERIGDYAKNIYTLAKSHPARLHGGSLEDEIAGIEERVAATFRGMVNAFKAHDVEESRRLMTDYKDSLSGDCEDIVHRIVSGSVGDLTPADAAAIVLYVRHLKRIAAHSRNILTSVVNPFHRIGYREQSKRK